MAQRSCKRGTCEIVRIGIPFSAPAEQRRDWGVTMKRFVVAVLAAVLVLAPTASAAAAETADDLAAVERAQLWAEAEKEAAELFNGASPEFRAWAAANGLGPLDFVGDVVNAINDYLGGSAYDGQLTGTNEAAQALNGSTGFALSVIGFLYTCPAASGSVYNAGGCAIALASLAADSTTQNIFGRVYAVEAFQSRQLARTVTAVGRAMAATGNAGTGAQCVYASVFIYCCEYTVRSGYYCWYQTSPEPIVP